VKKGAEPGDILPVMTDRDDSTAANSERPARSARSGGRRPAPSGDIPVGRSGVPTKWSIDRLDPRERRFSYLAAGASVLFGALIYFDETAKNHPKLGKNQLSPQTALVIAIGAAILLVVTVRIGRRAPVGFVALITGAAFNGSSLILGLPFFALAIWIFYHAFKLQKETSTALRASRAEARAASSQRPRSAGTSSAPRSGRAKSKAPTGPTPNKRYTPKTPVRPSAPPPKQSRRDRRNSTGVD
jgi:hypothetical protein